MKKVALNKKTANPSGGINILICDKCKIFSEGLKKVLTENKRYSTIEICADPSKARTLMDNNRYSLVIIEDSMIVGKKRSSILVHAKKVCPSAKIIVVSFILEEKFIDDLFSKGVHGFIPKQSGDRMILEIIYRVLEGEVIDNKLIAKKIKANNSKLSLELNASEFKLTSKEMDVLLLVTEGKSNKMIANELKLSERTVEFHKSNIYKKTKSASIAELVLFSISTRLL